MTSCEKAYFKVVGMYCTTCKPIVEKQLKDKDGIKKIDINYMTDTVVIEYNPYIINNQEIKKRLEDSGYKFVRAAHNWPNKIIIKLLWAIPKATVFNPLKW